MNRALYKRLADDLLAKIGTGTIEVGERFPPEEDYAEQLGVSRSTLRLAFNQLEQSGIIKRKQRGGTQVISANPVKRYNVIGNGLFDVLNVVKGTSSVLTDVRFVTAEDVDDLTEFQDFSSRWLCCAANRFIPGQEIPFTWANIYVPEHYSDIHVNAGDRFPTVFKRIEEQYDVSVGRVKQTISTIRCSETSANILGMEVGDPILTVVAELYDTDEHLLEVACSYFDPSRLNISSEVQIGS